MGDVHEVDVATRIVLASASPRRRDLLASLGVAFDVRPPDIDESVRPGELARDYVDRLSREKAAAVPAADHELVIAADTTVDLDGIILGKPIDADDARSMLRSLSARAHRVHTGITLSLGHRAVTEVVTTEVVMEPIGDSAIEWYVATGEPFDKAGAYALQGRAAVFVTSVRGGVSNVVGLPMPAVVRLARELGVELLG